MNADPVTSIVHSISALELELLARDALQLIHFPDATRFEALFVTDARLRCISGAAFDGRAAVARVLRRGSVFRRRSVDLRRVVVLEPFVLLHSGGDEPDQGAPFAALEVRDGLIGSWVEDRA
ncbi:hypothetical protein NVV95_00575 [Herbiconiux sp. CPCC 205716]|uniref:SnoaL-like domain-containing protein n=1 Tax=Herbiconiux gentiana TaxID=2970912 RepID=A0ABT2GA21_9MICO|nr:hypothetical protein [Herbiconiux gentiana]MCS5713038.1 hypothetical protein [Herbiconiux gentiana]